MGEIDDVIAVDPLIWAHHRAVKLAGGIPFSLDGRKYLVGLTGHKVSHIKKGSQVGATTLKFLDAVHGCVYLKYTQNILYMMPTVKAAEKMSKVAFSPILNQNGWIKRMVSNDSAGIKTINGRSILFVGGQQESVSDSRAKDCLQLKSVSADVVLRDEVDAMEDAVVEMSKQRLNNSLQRIEGNFGTPMVPGFGIDALFESGTQNKWQIPCGSCGSYTCLVESFPRSVLLVDDKWRRSCLNCGAEIFVDNGDWQPDFPDRREQSFWISGLLSPRADLEEYMHRWNHTKSDYAVVEFERSILGRASIESDCQLGVHDVLTMCQPEGMRTAAHETCQGVDVGEILHVVTGIRTGKDKYRILHIGEFGSFQELSVFNEKMGVKYCVIDKGPDIHGVKAFQDAEPYRVYRCQYSENQMQKPNFDRKTGVVKCNRNEVCDNVHAVYTGEQIILPRETPTIREYALAMTKTAKVTDHHPDTGQPKTRWVKLGDKNDHYFHATGYFMLACSQTPPIRHEGRTTNRIKIRSRHYV